MNRTYHEEFLAAMILAGLTEPEDKTEVLLNELEARMQAIQKALDEPGVKEVRIFRIPNSNTRRRFPIPPRKLR